ncbi:Rho-type gtpase-activating protein [Orbilia oligospora]|uniref:Rho-type gtpase-activating protein n=1 Tax=Orbilia oligospora TaxID=2813651 RepID=A0A7C8VZ21_ORBOL|nr:Rho-type gtpase-activating protein [Orbilia oligospora]
MMESPGYPPGSPLDVIDDSAFPCKGCGEILEEGKAFELAGNRWHIDCFRCNTCGTLLDSDANLLLLGDGSLICNNCTYSCNACGNKIEDLAILTGDQAFCAGCFRCRNCKRKIENLRYARTSQGIFCMSCHEGLMARRRKKSRNQPKVSSNQSLALDKALPMPPPVDTDSDSPTHKPAQPQAQQRLGPPPRPPRPEVSRAGSSGTTSRNRGDASPNSAHSPMATTPRHSPYPVHSPPATQNEFQFSKSTTSSNSNSNTNKAKSRQSMYSLVSDDNSELLSNSDHRASYFPLLLDEGPPPPIPSNVARSDTYAPRTIPPTQSVEIPPPQHSQSSPDDTIQEKSAKRAADNEANRVREEQQRKERERWELEKAEARKREAEAERQRELEIEKEKGRLESLERERQKQRDQGRQTREREDSRAADTERPNEARKEGVISDQIILSPQNFTTDVVSSSIPPAPSRSAPKADNIIPSHARKPTNPSESFKLQEVPRTKRATPKVPTDDEEEDSPTGEIEIPISFTPEPRKDSLGAPVPAPSTIKASSSHQEFVPSHQSSVSRKTNSETEIEATNSELSNYASSVTSINQTSPGGHKKAQPSSSSSIAPVRPMPARPATSHGAGGSSSFDLLNGSSPVLPPFKSELNFEEEIGKIFSPATDLGSPAMRRTSRSVGHGRSRSDMAGRSSMLSPDLPDILIDSNAKEENLVLKNALRRSTQQLVELESKLNTSVEIKESLENDIKEKRTTVASLEADKEMAMIELSVLRERLADADVKSINFDEFVATTLQEIAGRINALKESHKEELEGLIGKKNDAMEETATAIRLRDQAIQETEQLNLKNAQLADLNNELTRRIQGNFMKNKAAFPNVTAPIALPNGTGVYGAGLDNQSVLSHTGSTATITTSIISESTTLHEEGAAVVAAPHVVNIRKPGAPAKKFNWKKGGAAVGKGIGKTFGRVFASDQNDHHDAPMTLQSQPFSSTAYGPPVHTVDSPGLKLNGVDHNQQYGTQRGGLLKKLKGGNQSSHEKEIAVPLLGSELEARVAYEGRRIPQIITKCLAEVENRGLDYEGIYRKGGGASQVRMIQESFERGEEMDLENPDVDITAVTSVLKQYFRKLPTPLITYTIYDRMVDSVKIADVEQRKEAVKDLINELPSLNRDILFFIINHLTKVAGFQQENLMNARNLAVVFAPSLMRDQTGELELRDTHAKNEAIQFIIENAKPIFAGVNLVS